MKQINKSLRGFQKSMQEHLVDWKWAHITTEPGINEGNLYDSILPSYLKGSCAHIYPLVVNRLKAHQQKYKFKWHLHFDHMSSSQAACINLFLPILLSPNAEDVLKMIKPDIKKLARTKLDEGWQIEFYDGYGTKGVLGDKNSRAGTDVDIAIAYYNHKDELCLWLIEHKLTEDHFTSCGGYISDKNSTKHQCDHSSFSDILNNMDNCHYHRLCEYNYWNITEKNQSEYPNHAPYTVCPFKGGMNQLWRNTLMAQALKNTKLEGTETMDIIKHTYFSVVKHKENVALDAVTAEFETLRGLPKGSLTLTSDHFANAAEEIGTSELKKWVGWYRGMYRV